MQTQLAKLQGLQTRLAELWERTGDPALHRLSAGFAVHGPLEDTVDFGDVEFRDVAAESDSGEPDTLESIDPQSAEFLDWVSTALMDCYRKTGDGHVFGLLYELNEKPFRQAIQYQLRGNRAIEAVDVLQEVFLNIYRYPHRFLAERSDAFRNWGHRIVRNTLLKSLKGETRRNRLVSLDEDLGRRPDLPCRAPDRRAADAEIAVLADSAFILYLNLYWLQFQQLSDRERFALRMVEIDGASYKETAAALGIRLENLKMVIFRGRRKILRGMHLSLDSVLSAADPSAAVSSAGEPPIRQAAG